MAGSSPAMTALRIPSRHPLPQESGVRFSLRPPPLASTCFGMALYNLNFGDLGWRGRLGIMLATILGLAAISALILASVGLFLILLPFAAAAVYIGRWRLKKLMEREQARQRTTQPQTIETDYRVINGETRR
jgi:hypothetical protein